MKHKTRLLTFTAALALGLTGCSKSETGSLATDDAVAKTAEAATAAEAVRADAAKAVEAAKAEAAKAEAGRVEAAKAAEVVRAEAAKVEAARVAEAAKAADIGKAQGLIDKARSLVAESKFSDASSMLQQLTGLSLTSEQVKLVDALKEQIQQALAAKTAANAPGAAGNLLSQ